MGVIYKLRQEVVDFILHQKRLAPNISCRRLTALVQEQFRIDISKSAVNLVLKSNHLSNRVGRQAKSGTGKNFFIPQEKKDALRAQMAGVLPNVLTKTISDGSAATFSEVVNNMPASSSSGECGARPVNASSAYPESSMNVNGVSCGLDQQSLSMGVITPRVNLEGGVGRVLEQAQPPKTEKQGGRNEHGSPTTQADDTQTHLLPDPVFSKSFSCVADVDVGAMLFAKPCRVLTAWDGVDVTEHQQAIVVICLAWLWEMDPCQSLCQLLVQMLHDKGKNITKELAEGVLALRHAEQLVPKVMRSEVVDGIAKMIGIESQELNNLYKQVGEVLSSNQQACWAYESMLASLSTEAACFELKTVSGRRIYVDTLWTTFSDEPILQSKNCMPLFHATSMLANEFINNVEPIIIYTIDAQSLLGSGVFELLPILTGIDKDYVEIATILSRRGDRLSGFERLPHIRRNFIIISNMMGQDLHQIDFDNIGNMQRAYSYLDGSMIKYHEGKMSLHSDADSKAYVLDGISTETRRIVLTNMPDRWFSIIDGLLQWPEQFVDDKLLLNQKFDFVADKYNIYINLKDDNSDFTIKLQAWAATINRINIVNYRGQKCRICCKTE